MGQLETLALVDDADRFVDLTPLNSSFWRSAMERRLAAIMLTDIVGYSRLIGLDEEGTIARQRAHEEDVIVPKIAAYGGRIVKKTGDGLLVEFPSVVDAVRCAVDVQSELAGCETDVPEERRIHHRIGINLGDIVIDGDDILGDGVNIAARLEGLAKPGGICISGTVHDHLLGKLDAEFDDAGKQTVKNVPRPVRVWHWRPKEGVTDQFEVAQNRSDNVKVPSISTPNKEIGDQSTQHPVSREDQKIGFCRTADGVTLAYATVGQGSPVLFVQSWLTHLELDWDLPVRRHMYQALGQDHLVIRFDARGSGLSDSAPPEMTFETTLSDLAAVIDAIGFDQIALIGTSQGAASAAAYAARYPEKVRRLVLYGGYARGRRMRGSASQAAESEAFITLIREGWGKSIDAYIRMFGSFFMPDANDKQMAAFTEFQRQATSPENAARIRMAMDNIDITDELQNVQAPTLVLHVRDDAISPFEEGRQMAAAIPGARFIPLDGRNHAMLTNDTALKRYSTKVVAFLRD
ncbi:MAG: alpha/beta fold hydrolase [Hyphomicrobiaceae bacterium]